LKMAFLVFGNFIKVESENAKLDEIL